MQNTSEIVVVGLGYVGLPSAALIAEAGYAVTGVDIDTSLINELKAGKIRLSEPDVVRVVEQALSSGRLTVGTEVPKGDIFIICVPTPVMADNSADLRMVRSAIESVAPHVTKGNLVILESTSPLHTTRDVIGTALAERGLDPLTDVDVCYCPERVFPGDTVNEILNNDRVVGGLTPEAATRAAAFYDSFCKGKASTTKASSAEFSKLMENTFRDVNIALANAFSHIAETAGVDVFEVIDMANRHPRVNVHTPGPGVGGHCIPVDPWFLVRAFPQETGLLEVSRRINDGQAAHFVGRAMRAGLSRGDKVAILGAAYRKNIDDARDTPAALIIEALAGQGMTWATHDPLVTYVHSKGGHDPHLTQDLGAALEGASAAFLVTDHDAYHALTPQDFAALASKLLIDTRRLFNTSDFVANGFTVVPAGGPTLTP